VPLEAVQIHRRGQAQACGDGKRSLWISVFIESLVYLSVFSGQVQIRALGRTISRATCTDLRYRYRTL
jgi:hypothetical protein